MPPRTAKLQFSAHRSPLLPTHLQQSKARTKTTDSNAQAGRGYPGQITGGKRIKKSDPLDDEDDLAPEDEPLDLGPLSPRSLYALRNLARYGRQQRARAAGHGDELLKWDEYYPKWPRERRASVMVALFGGRTGELNVVLSTRAMDMRVNPGEVALPGGKVEDGDLSLEDTARREAFEEIGLPVQNDVVRHLCNLPPFLARSAPLLVTPVVCLILDPTLRPRLNPREVSNVFSHPLYSFLTDTPPSPHYVPDTVYNGTKPYRLQYDIRWLEGAAYRMFRFEGRLNPIWGFTADILIHVAMLAYKREPDFERKAPGQQSRRDIIAIAQQQLKEGTWPPPRQKLQQQGPEPTAEAKQKAKL